MLRLCTPENDPPNVKLCEPFSQLRSLLTLHVVVLRGAELVRTYGSLPSGKSSAYPPNSSNIDGVTFEENSLGDHCQPPLNSLTMFWVNVDRRPSEPVVR